jgi:quercetin dioxygenase-like cupin family protein
MITVDLNKLDLLDLTSTEDEKQHCRVTFPLLGAHGTKDTATVYFELNSGDNLGRHTDSAEELLLVLEGNVKAFIGDESKEVSAGSIAVVPKMVPHDLKNTGITTAKVLGIFGGANNIVSTFDKGWQPNGEKVVSTAALVEQPQE